MKPIDILVHADGLYDDPLLFLRGALERELDEETVDPWIAVGALDEPLDLGDSLARRFTGFGVRGHLDVFDGHPALLGGLEFHTDIGGRGGRGTELKDLEVRGFEGRVGRSERGDLRGELGADLSAGSGSGSYVGVSLDMRRRRRNDVDRLTERRRCHRWSVPCQRSTGRPPSGSVHLEGSELRSGETCRCHSMIW